MKYIETRNDLSKKLGALSALGIVAFAPLFGAPQNAEAQPPGHAPAWGYRNRNNTTQASIVSGVVVSNSGRGFVLRTSDGRTTRVQTDYEPSNLTVGDRVVVNGRFTGNTFIANSVRVVRDRDTDWNGRDNDWNDRGSIWNGRNVEGRRVIATGVVTRDLPSGNAFDMRTDTGLPVRVRTRANEPRRLRVGDRVEVSGFAESGRLRADSVRLLNDRNPRDINERTLTGVVTRDRRGDFFDVRTDDGRTVTVRAREGEPTRLTRGDRVVIDGRYNANRDQFAADRIRITRNDDRFPNRDTDGRGRVDFSATVIDGGTLWGANVLTVRGDNGREYRVNVPRNSQSNFRRGDRVRVVGTQLEANRVQAISVVRL